MIRRLSALLLSTSGLLTQPAATSHGAKGEVTFGEHVAPIIFDNGTFRGDQRLDDDEIATILGRVETGMAEGNPARLPPNFTFTAGWQLGPPDLVVRRSTPRRGGGRRGLLGAALRSRLEPQDTNRNGALEASQAAGAMAALARPPRPQRRRRARPTRARSPARAAAAGRKVTGAHRVPVAALPAVAFVLTALTTGWLADLPRPRRQQLGRPRQPPPARQSPRATRRLAGVLAGRRPALDRTEAFGCGIPVL